MNRDIEFRGKIINSSDDFNGKWHYGYLTYNEDSKKAYIGKFTFDNYYQVEVDPETIGQFTGLKDKNGNKIFEGDLLKVPPTHFNVGGVHEVYFYSDGWVTSSVLFNEKETACKDNLKWRIKRESTKIGNIHENKELLNK